MGLHTNGWSTVQAGYSRQNTGTLVWLLGPCQYDQLCALLADKGRRQQHHRSGICISLDDPIEHERRSYA